MAGEFQTAPSAKSLVSEVARLPTYEPSFKSVGQAPHPKSWPSDGLMFMARLQPADDCASGCRAAASSDGLAAFAAPAKRTTAAIAND